MRHVAGKLQIRRAGLPIIWTFPSRLKYIRMLDLT